MLQANDLVREAKKNVAPLRSESVRAQLILYGSSYDPGPKRVLGPAASRRTGRRGGAGPIAGNAPQTAAPLTNRGCSRGPPVQRDDLSLSQRLRGPKPAQQPPGHHLR